jgi:hypothetical protein
MITRRGARSYAAVAAVSQQNLSVELNDVAEVNHIVPAEVTVTAVANDTALVNDIAVSQEVVNESQIPVEDEEISAISAQIPSSGPHDTAVVIDNVINSDSLEEAAVIDHDQVTDFPKSALLLVIL